MPKLPDDLWGLAWTRQHLDPHELAAAIQEQVRKRDLDYRSRVLIRDSVKALRGYWGPERTSAWLEASPFGREIEAICNQEFDDDRGFPSLMWRVVDVTRPEALRHYFEQLGRGMERPTRLDVVGSASLILQEYIARHTEVIPVVDEVPAPVRTRHRFLHELQGSSGLRLGHLQSHYLPRGWEKRVHSQEPYGRLRVYLVDVLDLCLSKLFSGRRKDLDDLREMCPLLDKDTLTRRLQETTTAFQAVPCLLEGAQRNWYILFGEPFPS
jgi:hypothetical protein